MGMTDQNNTLQSTCVFQKWEHMAPHVERAHQVLARKLSRCECPGVLEILDSLLSISLNHPTTFDQDVKAIKY